MNTATTRSYRNRLVNNLAFTRWALTHLSFSMFGLSPSHILHDGGFSSASQVRFAFWIRVVLRRLMRDWMRRWIWLWLALGRVRYYSVSCSR